MSRDHGIRFSRQLAISFALLMALAALWTVVSYLMAERVLRDEVMRANGASLKQLSALTDNQIDEALTAMRQYELNAVFLSVAAADRTRGQIDGYPRRQIYQILQTSKRALYRDVFFYYQNSQVIISRRYGSCSFDLYHQAQFGKDERSWTEWALLLAANHSGDVMRIDYTDGSKTLLLLVSLPISSFAKANVTVGCVFDAEQLVAQLTSACLQDGAAFLLDAENEVIAASEGAPALADGTLPDASDAECRLNGVYYIAQSEISAYGCRYVSIIPISVFWARLDVLRLSQGVGLCLFLLSGCCLAMYLTHRAYKPVSDLVNTLSTHSHSSFDRRAENELNYISNTFLRTLSDMRLMSRQLTDSHALLCQRFLMERLDGARLEEAWRQAFARYDVPLISDVFLTAMLRPESEPPADLIATLESLSCDAYLLYAFRVGPGDVALLINPADDAPEAGAQIAREILSYINGRCALMCTMALSAPCRDANEICQIWRQAQMLMEHRLLYGAGSLILPDCCRNDRFTPNPAFRKKAEGLLIAALSATSPDATSLYDELYVCFLGDQTECLAGARAFLSALSLQTAEAAQNALNAEFSSLHDRLDAFFAADTLPAFRRAFCALIQDARALLSALRNRNALSDAVVDYLEQNYADPTLGVNTLGERFQISPGYLSQRFKQQCGRGVSETLTAIRLRRAAQLLLGTELSVEEIAQGVGLPSMTSFNRLFKKAYDITPGAYRKSERAGRDES